MARIGRPDILMSYPFRDGKGTVHDIIYGENIPEHKLDYYV